MTPPPTDPPDVQAAREAARALRHADCIAAEMDAHAALDAALDTLTARLAVVEGERETWVCACGLPMSRNPHPDAGKPAALLDVGAVWVCIPCTVKSRHGATTARFQAERDRDAAAATERARTLHYLTVVRRRIPGTRGFTAEMQLLFGVLVDEIAAAIESNAHHEATK